MEEAQREAGFPVKVWLCLVGAMVLCGCATTPDTRLMKLVVTGEKGTMFTARYKADGVLQEHTGLMPETIPFRARNVEWEVTRPSGYGGFQVEFVVGDHKRLSTSNGGRRTIRGAYKSSLNQESYWARPVD